MNAATEASARERIDAVTIESLPLFDDETWLKVLWEIGHERAQIDCSMWVWAAARDQA